MDQSTRLQDIRKRIGLGALENKEFLECKSIPGGVPRGVICEISGSARTEWLISLLLSHPALSIFWAEPKLTLLPTALQQRGIALSRVLLAETEGDKLLQSIRKALRSKIFDCVVVPGTLKETKILRALQLFARESNAAVFFLSKTLQKSWVIPFQIQADWVQGSQKFDVQVVKTKFASVDEA